MRDFASSFARATNESAARGRLKAARRPVIRLRIVLGALAFIGAGVTGAQAQGVYGFSDNYGVFSASGGRSTQTLPSGGAQQRPSVFDRGNSWRPGGNYVYPSGNVAAPRPSIDVGAGYGGTYRGSYGGSGSGVYGGANAGTRPVPRGNITVTAYGGTRGAVPSQAASVYADPADAEPDYDDPSEYDYENAPLPVYRAATGAKGVDPMFNRHVVHYTTNDPAGTIIVDTGARFLYLVQGGGKALRYGIGVGREGFAWSGTQRITNKKEWPEWRPPAEMIARRPGLPNYMPGGPDNPLGARAMYLGDTLYRIHGSNEPETIGTAVSSGCIRMRNQDVIDLYQRVPVGTMVRVI